METLFATTKDGKLVFQKENFSLPLELRRQLAVKIRGLDTRNREEVIISLQRDSSVNKSIDKSMWSINRHLKKINKIKIKLKRHKEENQIFYIID